MIINDRFLSLTVTERAGANETDFPPGIRSADIRILFLRPRDAIEKQT